LTPPLALDSPRDYMKGMQTYRAYIADPAGTITWAAWIEAGHLAEARQMAEALRPGGGSSVDLWSAGGSGLPAGVAVDPV
jgi:hypothetical protein